MSAIKTNLAAGTIIVLTLALLVLPATSTRATLVEGFESGVLAAGSAMGDASIRTPNYFGIAPTEGSHQLLLTSINNLSDPGYTNQSGTDNAVSVTAIAAFLGVSTSSIRDGLVTGQEGSALRLNLGFLNIGDVVTFNYNFTTNEVQPGAHNDFAFMTLSGLSGNMPVLSNTLGTMVPTTGAGNPFVLESLYLTYTINITVAGNYTLGLGVIDGTTSDVPSALMVDNIQIIPVPEPSTFGLALAGGTLLVGLRSRFRKRSL